MSSPLATLLEERGPVRSVGVVGMGYVGIPAAVLFAHAPGIEQRARLSARLPVVGVQDRDAEPGGEPAQRGGARPRAPAGRRPSRAGASPAPRTSPGSPSAMRSRLRYRRPSRTRRICSPTSVRSSTASAGSGSISRRELSSCSSRRSRRARRSAPPGNCSEETSGFAPGSTSPSPTRRSG